MTGRLILVHGASSAGKSTLCRAAQQVLPSPFLYHSADLYFRDALPPGWHEVRDAFFAAFHRTYRVFSEQGVDVISDYIVETPQGFADLTTALQGIDVFWVGLHAPLAVLEQRERARGDRRVGDARRDLETVHGFRDYHLDLDGTRPPEDNARLLVDAWQRRDGAQT
ncbi:chloramphenicol phosphotransferase [Aeromicrobium phragmitis]|uniref:Chloramphenicol phosphotransferase n=1 Tax=Aeromicrobium phragmitis TaxID=2478914 RepID=A0A3L8PLM5_9ACTN|nr:AAA family ATPase [Aeromicrobium phragmitis]RLV56306.1 chloramphenicol phosphotransferase [Aeromicrobium phragmitis]